MHNDPCLTCSGSRPSEPSDTATTCARRNTGWAVQDLCAAICYVHRGRYVEAHVKHWRARYWFAAAGFWLGLVTAEESNAADEVAL